MKRYGMLLALLLASLPATAQDPLLPVLQCLRANVPPTMRIQEVELTSIDRGGGERVLSGKLFAMREKLGAGYGPVRAMLRVTAPEGFAGAAYLVRQSDDYLSEGMYVYLPTVKRVRRVTGTFADGSLLGTDFSYNDFRQLQNAFSGMQATLEPAAQIEGHATQVLWFKAPQESQSRYDAVRVWVDQKTCVPLQAEYMEGKTVSKRLSMPAASLRKSGNYWYAEQAEMRDLKEGTRTTLRILGVTHAKELPGRYFDPNAFYLGN